MSASLLSSGDLARATGNTARTVRFYEEQGLLRPAEVSGGGHRRFTPDDLERLRLILDLRELGLSLCDIRAFLDLRAGCDTAAEFAIRFREVLLRHLDRADERLDRLRRVKRELREALATIQHSLPKELAEACPCAVAATGETSRIVRLLAEVPTCCHHQVDAASVRAEGVPGRTGSGGEETALSSRAFLDGEAVDGEALDADGGDRATEAALGRS